VGSVVSVTPRPLYSLEGNPVPIVLATAWDPGPGSHRDLIPVGYCPVGSESLNLLSHPGPQIMAPCQG